VEGGRTKCNGKPTNQALTGAHPTQGEDVLENAYLNISIPIEVWLQVAHAFEFLQFASVFERWVSAMRMSQSLKCLG